MHFSPFSHAFSHTFPMFFSPFSYAFAAIFPSLLAFSRLFTILSIVNSDCVLPLQSLLSLQLCRFGLTLGLMPLMHPSRMWVQRFGALMTWPMLCRFRSLMFATNYSQLFQNSPTERFVSNDIRLLTAVAFIVQQT